VVHSAAAAAIYELRDVLVGRVPSASAEMIAA
jgi:hypothetical protein